MSIQLEGDNAWPDLRDKRDQIVHLAGDGSGIQVAVLDAGMESGKPSVALRFDLPDGRTVIAETSARLYCTIGRAIQARYPDLFED